MDQQPVPPSHGSDSASAKRSRVTEDVYERLLSKILEQELAPGTLVSELSLAKELGVSRTPVHRAIRELIADGLVVERGRRRPVIAKFSGEMASMGLLDFIGFVALISINLGFMNLLPIPMLDGGHLLLYAVEAVRRRPATPIVQEWAFRAGFAMLAAFMIMVTFNDLASFGLFGSG